VSSPRLSRRIARWRVPLGFLLGAVVLWRADPTWSSLLLGASIATIGEAIRLWAAGHVEKSREVTRSGPYRFVRHPLYLGTTLIALGLSIASASPLVAVMVLVYVGITIPAAIRAEEAHLREKFGGAYDSYVQRASTPMVRSFSLERAIGNREHHTVAGLVVALALLALKVQLSLP
jgi:protein-S-isoprenylcysteine O-methyltransferase Ste14